MAQAAHGLGPKDKKSVGGGFPARLVLISSVCSVLLGAACSMFSFLVWFLRPHGMLEFPLANDAVAARQVVWKRIGMIGRSRV